MTAIWPWILDVVLSLTAIGVIRGRFERKIWESKTRRWKKCLNDRVLCLKNGKKWKTRKQVVRKKRKKGLWAFFTKVFMKFFNENVRGCRRLDFLVKENVFILGVLPLIKLSKFKPKLELFSIKLNLLNLTLNLKP